MDEPRPIPSERRGRVNGVGYDGKVWGTMCKSEMHSAVSLTQKGKKKVKGCGDRPISGRLE